MQMLKALVKKVNNWRLAVKITMIIFITSLVLLIVEIVSRRIVYQAYDEQLYLRTAQVLAGYASQLEVVFDKVDTVTLSIIGDSSIQSDLSLQKAGGATERLEARNAVKTQLSSYMMQLENCDMLNIVLPDGGFVDTNRMNQEQVERVIRYSKEKQGSLALIPEERYVWCVRQIRQSKYLSLDELGIIVIRINLHELMQGLIQKGQGAGMAPELAVYAGGECLYSTINGGEVVKWERQSDGWDMIDEQFVVRTSSLDLGWTIYSSVPYAKINQSVQRANFSSILLTLTAALAGIFLCRILVKHIVVHIDVLLDKFRNFGNGELPDPEESGRYLERTDEIGVLHNQFDKMARDYKKIEEEHYNSMLLIKEAQMDSLQKQIHPHFLFNTLSTIVWSAYENNDEKTAKMGEALCTIFRHSIRRNSKVATIREEMKVVEDYVYIQKIRYANRFTMEICLPEQLYDVQIPSFTLQPIVENVIVHVVERTLEPCVIRIRGRIYEDHVEILVEDTGKLLKKDTLDRLEEGAYPVRGNGVGLNNINQRLKLMFSEEYGLEIANTPEYSCVVVRLPGLNQ